MKKESVLTQTRCSATRNNLCNQKKCLYSQVCVFFVTEIPVKKNKQAMKKIKINIKCKISSINYNLHESV